MKDCSVPRILEVKTGEGKTIVIECIALYKALDNIQVDITTSNPVLAKEGAEEAQKFFKELGITVDYLKDNEEDKDGEGKDCYNVDVLYGTAHLFCADILNEHCSLVNIRNERQKRYMIVDEVDSMMLDSINYRTIIADQGTRSDLFDYIKQKIWFDLISFTYAETDPEEKKQEITNGLHNEVGLFLEYQNDLSKDQLASIKLRVDDWVQSAWHALFNLDKDVNYTVSKDHLNVSVLPF
jgi:preprotein translocase subunit SecA